MRKTEVDLEIAQFQTELLRSGRKMMAGTFACAHLVIVGAGQFAGAAE
jgi:hypothetical protein